MTPCRLTDELAERVMGWAVKPDRFLTGNRRWIPRWRFQPAKHIADALQLLTAAAPEGYKIVADERGQFNVQTVIGGRTGHAVERLLPLAITLAVARAIGVNGLLEAQGE